MLSSTNHSGRPSKRIRLACLRCQGRKIKCDGGVPKCSACQRADADCIDGRKTHDDSGAISRTEAAALHTRIQELERSLRLSEAASDAMPSDAASTSGSLRHDNPHEAGAQYYPDDRPETSNGNSIAHEIGLVPLSSGANKYVGPSSGLAFTKLIFNRVSRAGGLTSISYNNSHVVAESPSTATSRELLTIESRPLPTSKLQAVHLSRTYFEYVHIQYPLLHEPTYFTLLDNVYEDETGVTAWGLFQVTMVLAISASILCKRLPISVSGESLCKAAMERADQVDMQSSIQGLQCLLLVCMFSLHNSSFDFSPWHLNYQCLATVLDLGLQREIPSSSQVSVFDREMRTRLFWVVYSIDRTLATTLGRPIGLRDEACDLRSTQGMDEDELKNPHISNQQTCHSELPKGYMTCSSVLFELAQLNSEIKYILHSVSHKTPRYTYPQIIDLEAWRGEVAIRLRDANRRMTQFTGHQRYLTITCSIKYHEVTMHLFRPTPRSRNPSTTHLRNCYESAQRSITLWKELYEMDRLSSSWTMIHSVCLSAITILYCIWTSSQIATDTRIDVLTNLMRDASVLLSAAGEHWVEARRSRACLDSLASATVRWLIDKLIGRQPHTHVPLQSHTNRDASDISQAQSQQQMTDDLPLLDTYISNDDLAAFLGASDSMSNDNGYLMESMFVDYQPFFNFGSSENNSFET